MRPPTYASLPRPPPRQRHLPGRPEQDITGLSDRNIRPPDWAGAPASHSACAVGPEFRAEIPFLAPQLHQLPTSRRRETPPGTTALVPNGEQTHLKHCTDNSSISVSPLCVQNMCGVGVVLTLQTPPHQRNRFSSWISSGYVSALGIRIRIIINYTLFVTRYNHILQSVPTLIQK